jgi:hypothetical protein
MTDTADVDPEALQEDLDRIKDAMGIQDRYPSWFHLWLVYAALVLGASVASQLIVLNDLAGYWHGVAWFGFMGAGGIYQWWLGSQDDQPSVAGTPNILVQFGAVGSLYVVYLLILGPVVEGLSQRMEAILIFSLIVALVGVAYVVVGESLKAYRIRALDRYAFYVGGAWMLVLAVLFPNVEILQTWGYLVFGVLYAVHGVGSYVLLARV